ncbi:hypothetical protein QX204_34110 (plasmid) [Nocardia sp. PE-7]|uniref:hypothetical protein n=1 Tax=Nocardia sp. PE-7 TaxID=3058426 RepID=UPI002657ECD3|nr:hypothetical protein [Nocardia sp. PE-7]WKG13589.1 hypothetical protein QX204_34110 [Nocardia sp. PE-7]
MRLHVKGAPMRNRPRIERKPGEIRLWVTMPYDPTTPNRGWMQEVLGGRKDLVWNKEIKRWEVARKHLKTLIAALAERFGEVEVLLEFNTTERCNGKCRTATIPVWECTCKCLGEYHGGRGEQRDWIPVGPHRLISKTEKLVHFVVHRGDMPAPTAPVRTSTLVPPQPLPSSLVMPPRPPAISAQPTPSVAVPTQPSPAPASAPAPPAAVDGEELPPGCGIAMFAFAFAVFSLLALGISPWFWIGSALTFLAGLATFVDGRG